ncbi:hypothetical protein [Vandammella animalimorsus]|uniref:hypothetical protein n=1 Tax=Vandammella animalimorsus TaxID=2029117 RepID=UPI00117D4821|nr:hypothetical protein [Vandammella animalimorsus]
MVDTSTFRQVGGATGVNAGQAADAAYEAIRASKIDVIQISRNTGLKIENIQKIKNHLFCEKHLLDRYEKLGIRAEMRRFDSSEEIANAWGRLVKGDCAHKDIQLLKHEIAEAWHMRHHGPIYNNAHNAASKNFPSPLE